MANWHAMAFQNPDEVKSVELSAGLTRRVWELTSPYRGLIVGFLATIIGSALLGAATPLLIRSILNDAIPDRDRGLANLLAGGIVVVAVGSGLLSLLSRWWSSRIGEGLIYDLRVKLFDHVQRQPIAFFTTTQTGSLISRVNGDVVGAQRAVTGTLGSVVTDVITLLTALVALLYLEWRLTLIALVLLPLFLIPSKRVGKKLQRMTRESMELNASMNTTMTERFNVSGALLVKLFGRHADEHEEFGGRAARVRDIGIRLAVYMRVFMLGLSVVGALGTAAVYLIGSQMVIDGSLKAGDIVAMGILVGQIYQPLASLTGARVDIMTAFVSFDRVFEILDAPNPIQDKPDAVAIEFPRGEITLEAVSFTYPAPSETTVASLEQNNLHTERSGPVLNGIDAHIEPGQLIALVGPSGAGKTTLASLIPRLYDVSDGAILIDGQDVRDVTQESLRDAIGVVSQDPHMFHESVAANLRYAKPDATQAELEDAARAAQIHDVIAALPEGYDTMVGERGYRLSGGEKQRLAIARMLLKDPSIVVLDEATSHLDSENESQVQQALTRALEGRTAIVIAHRLSTITEADQILVIDNGTIVERGRHHELLATEGLYADLYHTLIRETALPV